MPPGTDIDDWLTFFISGLWRLYYKLSREGKIRFYNEFLPLLHTTKHDVLGQREENAYYLVYLGTKPSARGKGYAKMLLEDITAQVGCQDSISSSNSLVVIDSSHGRLT